jgi:hypothetical protein
LMQQLSSLRAALAPADNFPAHFPAHLSGREPGAASR